MSGDDDDFQIEVSNLSRVIVSDDGNCHYRANSHFICGSEDNHALVKNAILEFYRSNDVQIFGGWIDKDPKSHAKEIEPDGKWGGHAEIKVAATLVQKTIYLFRPQQQEQSEPNFEMQKHKPFFVGPAKWIPVLTAPITFICTTPEGTHFDALIPRLPSAPLLTMRTSGSPTASNQSIAVESEMTVSSHPIFDKLLVTVGISKRTNPALAPVSLSAFYGKLAKL